MNIQSNFSSEEVLYNHWFEKISLSSVDKTSQQLAQDTYVVLYGKDHNDYPYIAKIDDLWLDDQQKQDYLKGKSLYVWPQNISINDINKHLIDR